MTTFVSRSTASTCFSLVLSNAIWKKLCSSTCSRPFFLK
ncbi:unnamed protein product [Amoebophrya sp. A25]|nr:unnamed protein product [Amoebophrya sp. A25]|eukprot:GSA25T00007408001.1